MLRRWLAWVVAVTAVVLGASYAISWITAWPAAVSITQPGPIIVISQPTLSWNDVSPARTPALWSLAERGAVGALATRDLSEHSCSNQSWLTFSAGARTTIGFSVPATPAGKQPKPCAATLVPDQPGGAPAAGQTATANYPLWAKWRHLTLSRPQPADIGRLGTSLPAIGQCITAAGPDAALGAANHAGVVEHYTPDVTNVDLSACPITFISMSTPDDTLLGQLLKRAPANATIVVAGFADAWGPEVMHTVVISGPGVPHGLLTSISTQQPGLVQTTDLSALVLSRLGAKAPHLPEGRTPVVQPRPAGDSAIVDASTLARQFSVEHALVAPIMLRCLGGVGVGLIIGGVWWLMLRRRGHSLSAPLRMWLSLVAAAGGCFPVATWLIGLFRWWHFDHSGVALGWGIAAIMVLLAVVAVFGPWRRWRFGAALFIAAVTMLTIVFDTTHGSALQLTSIMGLQPVYGGRFFGMGNVGYALLATSALMLAAVLAGQLESRDHRRLALATVILIGLTALAVDGNPTWGADGGGPLAMFPAFAYLGLNAAGLRLTWRRVIVILATSVGIVGTLAVLDYLRPPKYRTHLGDFIAALRDHGELTGVERIWQANWTMLTGTWYTMLVPILLALVILALALPHLWPGRLLTPLVDQVPMLGQGLAATTVCWLLGFLSNDSGTSIPPTGMVIVAPMLILMAVHHTKEPSEPLSES
ncbi:hypothetical protein [Rudaeicoccus suwonensis]|uniref:Transmembrane protein n=1 Tax=Rudaeicoccus suwonensis TaxID=657409 RepID=A0A561E6P8_9MICO|nr:hypothetical protein [Rudaeicoccus suwonensis]TWE11281.1 hypothetical protein BKA23_0043 [Rudaeicoccus suwonensis]